eukprot:4083372-Prymnesium_polylepis.1
MTLHGVALAACVRISVWTCPCPDIQPSVRTYPDMSGYVWTWGTEWEFPHATQFRLFGEVEVRLSEKCFP